MDTIRTINPATEEVIQSYPLMKQEELDDIFHQAKKVQETWANSEFSARKKNLLNLEKLLLERKEQYARLMTLEMGKPIQQSIGEIEKCAKLCRYYAEAGEKFLALQIIETDYFKSYRCFQPLGVIFAIMPWNFPFWQVLRFAVPNLTLGNAGILKHAPTSFGTALAIEKLFEDAGYPKNLFRSILIDVDLASFVIHHPTIAGVTLTGSNRAGKYVAKEAGKAVKKVVLELGGSDPYVILEDADLELASDQCIKSRLSNCGQICISAKRIIVAKKIQKEFENLLIEKAKAYQMGDPLDPHTLLGPMARKDLRDKLHEQVEKAISEGARCVLGGKIPDKKGYFYPATILLDVKPDFTPFKEELFGPVICVTVAENEKEAIEFANKSKFGLSAAIFTNDLERGEKLALLIQAGTCAVNSLVASDPRLPFGGIKQSGFGRELSEEGMREFANIKTLTVSVPKN